MDDSLNTTLQRLLSLFRLDRIGALAYRLAGGGRMSPVYLYLYNLTHRYLTSGLLVGHWALAVGAEWAMLAVPILLPGDRGIFGNTWKPTALPFEPIEIGTASG
jgi:hypothetical protein